MQVSPFGTDGVRGRFGPDPISPGYFFKLGFSVGRALLQKATTPDLPSVVIGRDTRGSCPELENALSRGLRAAGVDVLLAGIVPTPAVAFLTVKHGASAGAVISASHNPAHDNGLKFFDGSGYKISEDFKDSVVAGLNETVVAASCPGREVELADPLTEYVEFTLAQEPTLDLSGLKIVLDTAHGAAYRSASLTLARLGAQLVLVGAAPDGLNINEAVGATSPQTLQRAVLAHSADIGISLDGDADRLIMAGPDGALYDGDALLYVLACDLQGRQPVHGVAGTIVSNMGLELALGHKGIKLVRTPVGDAFLMRALLEKDWLLGGEGSGHLLDLSRHTTGDGTMAALAVLGAMKRAGRSLAELTQDLILLPQHVENIRVQDGGLPRSDWAKVSAVLDAVESARVAMAGQGRVLLRSSGTEPLFRVTVEALSVESAKLLAQNIAAVVRKHCLPELTSNLESMPA